MVEIENVHGRKIRVQGGGTGIYCGSDGTADGLRDEHVIPYSLDGTAEPLQASCSELQKITSYLDGYLVNATRDFPSLQFDTKSLSSIYVRGSRG